MRVISGKARGTKIQTIENNSTRPTLDRVKESLFNIIQSKVPRSNILDLFAGSGALGIEALSRNAEFAVFCDSNNECTKIIRQNLEKTKLETKALIYNNDYKSCIKNLKNKNFKFDIVFIDPPYMLNIAAESLKLIIENNLLKDEAIIVIETDQRNRDMKEIQEMNINKIKVYDERKYGRANLIFIRKIEENENGNI